MAGLNPQANYASNDTTFLSGLRSETWADPLTEENQCSDLSTILINASVSSYDDNDTAIPGVPGGINGSSVNANNGTTDQWTDDVGSLEDLYSGRQFFIGRNGTDNNEACDAKTINALSDVLGLCPEAPTVNGSYAMAGIAYYAHNNDLRADLEGNQTLNTFAISLATNIPIIQIPRTDGGTTVDILPAYRNLSDPTDPGGGALVDFRIVRPHSRIAPDDERYQAGNTDRFAGEFYVSWEDSEQGGDYDQDMWGIIEYVLDESDNELTITTTAVGESSTTPQLFGFVTNGTTQDGFHAYSGIENVTLDEDPTGVPGCVACNALRTSVVNAGDPIPGQAGPQSHTFSIEASNIETLESPLFLAAKYGGFIENRAVDEPASLTDAPDEIEEWDAVNNTTGEIGADGLPDNFFFVINPENLFNSLEASLNKILSENRAASSAVASFANSNGFGNLIVQGTYQELTRQPPPATSGSVVRADLNWTGELFSYFIDPFGFFREDTNSNGRLDDYAVDRAFRYEIDDDDTPLIRYFNPNRDADGLLEIEDGLPSATDAESVPLASLNPLWDAGDRLRALNNDGVLEQRPYDSAVPTDSTTTAPSRYIFTYIDEDLNGEVDAGEQRDFVASEIDDTNFGFFGVGSEAVADSIVNYIRGFEDPDVGFRNRTLVSSTGIETVHRLGDLVNSRPLVVGFPSAGYDTQFDDESYAAFVEQYANRRNVVYVGGNDGLLHAFNAGFRGLDVISSIDEIQYDVDDGVTGTANHPLGAEIWAYAPYNLLPHMQWLTSNFYSHVFYVDGSPQSFDVKIFEDDAKHPGGWGTILVVGMRQGGGDFPINQGGISTTTQSAIMVLDITDPEDPPVLLAEITHDFLNMTTSEPDVFYDCNGNCDGQNVDRSDDFDGDWKLVFGSGPTNLKTFASDDNARVFSYDLKTKNLEVQEVTVGSGTASSPVPNSFVSSVASADWDNGNLGFRNDDAVYFGTVGTRLNEVTPDTTDVIETGAVYRYFPGDVPTGSNTTSLFFDTDRPVAQRPTLVSRENIGNDVLGSWLFFGTGIYLTRDNESTSSQERFYGIYETVDRTEVAGLNDQIVPGLTGNIDRENSDLITYETITANQLVDVSDTEVLTVLGAASPPLVNSPVPGVNTAGQLATFIAQDGSVQGWFRDLPLSVVAGDPSARLTDAATTFIDQVFFVTFSPGVLSGLDICAAGIGTADLFIVDQTIGLPLVGTLGSDGTPETNNDSIGVGSSPVKAPVVGSSEALGANRGTIILQRGDGSIIQETDGQDLNGTPTDTVPEIRAGWRELIEL